MSVFVDRALFSLANLTASAVWRGMGAVQSGRGGTAPHPANFTVFFAGFMGGA